MPHSFPRKAAAALVLTVACGSADAPSHTPISTALTASYTQTVISGTRKTQVSYDGGTGIDDGRLCLFQGGQYSFSAHRWWSSSEIKGDKPDWESSYGEYSQSAQVIVFTGPLSGSASVVADTISVGGGVNKFMRDPALTAACEGSR